MKKAVLLSIRPEWCTLIVNGQKTVEIRKSRPKLIMPFKVYIYCTKGFKSSVPYSAKTWAGRGKVIGEFICDKIVSGVRVGTSRENAMYNFPLNVREQACLSQNDIERYGNGATIYGWHISNLKLYDQARGITQFTRLHSTKFGFELNAVERPPQSWYYVEVI